MGATNRGDFVSVARGREPVVDRRADPPALDRRIAGPGMAGNQQKHPFTVNEGVFQRPINGLPGAIQIMAMKIDNSVGLDRAGG